MTITVRNNDLIAFLGTLSRRTTTGKVAEAVLRAYRRETPLRILAVGYNMETSKVITIRDTDLINYIIAEKQIRGVVSLARMVEGILYEYKGRRFLKIKGETHESTNLES